MTEKKLAFVSFQLFGDSYVASLALDRLDGLEGNWEVKLKQATSVYANAITDLRDAKAKLYTMHAEGKPVPAKEAWKLGDRVFSLVHRLSRLGLEVDGLYTHLCRDLGVKRMWLEKMIIFRSHIPKAALIPATLKWAQCRDAPKQSAYRILSGQLK